MDSYVVTHDNGPMLPQNPNELLTALSMLTEDVRGAIKKFSAWPSYVPNKIKIVFASYSNSSKAQDMTCTIWLLGYNILCILAVVGYLQSKWKKAVSV